MYRNVVSICIVLFTYNAIAMKVASGQEEAPSRAHNAVMREDLAEFKQIVSSEGFDPNVTWSGKPLLHFLLYALKISQLQIKRCNPEFIKEAFTLLLGLPRLNPNMRDNMGQTALQFLVEGPEKAQLPVDLKGFMLSSLRARALLPTIGLSAEAEPADLQNPAHIALMKGDLARFKKIVTATGFDPNVRWGGATLLHVLIHQLHTDRLQIVKHNPQFIKEALTILLSLPGLNPNMRDSGGQTPLELLLSVNQDYFPISIEMLRFIFFSLLALPTIDLTGENQEQSEIDYAPLSIEFIKPLIERGAQPRLDIFIRAKEKQPELYDYLIKNSDAAIFYAITEFDMTLLQRVTSSPTFRPNAFYKRELTSCTPFMYVLHTAKDKKRTPQEIFIMLDTLLCVPGTNINLTNPQGFSAVAFAAEAGVDYVKYVRAKGASWTAADLHVIFTEAEPSVLDFIKNEEVTVPQRDEMRPDQNKRFAPPSGKYTFGQVYEAMKCRILMDKEKKKCAHCKKLDCTKYCSLCKQAYYCSVDHQRADWENHKREFHQPKQCSICLEDVSDGRSEYCGHAVHQVCIDKWKLQSKQCPVCKAHLD